MSLDSKLHDTLLPGKTLSFTPMSKNNGQGPEWSRVTFEKGVKIIGKKEVRRTLLALVSILIESRL